MSRLMSLAQVGAQARKAAEQRVKGAAVFVPKGFVVMGGKEIVPASQAFSRPIYEEKPALPEGKKPKHSKSEKKWLKRLKVQMRRTLEVPKEPVPDIGRQVVPHRSGGAQVAVAPVPQGSAPGTPFDDFERRVCEIDQCEHMAVCYGAEMALRHYTYEITLPPMTPEQREWCLEEIASVEGYRRAEFEDATDKELANGVMAAWADYCRDKGMM